MHREKHSKIIKEIKAELRLSFSSARDILKLNSFKKIQTWIALSFTSLLLAACVADVSEPTVELESKLVFSRSASLNDRVETFDFGTAAIGGYYDASIFVINAGKTLAQNIRDNTATGQKFTYLGGAYPGTGGTCGNELAVDASCVLRVRFSPTASATETGKLEFDYEDKVVGPKKSELSLTGIGGTPAALAISDGPTYDYGLVAIGLSVDYTFTITNSGESRAVNISEIGLTGVFQFKGAAYPGDGGTCAVEIPGNSSCTMVITFAPLLTGSIVDQINILYFDGVNNQNALRNVQGEGVMPAVL